MTRLALNNRKGPPENSAAQKLEERLMARETSNAQRSSYGKDTVNVGMAAGARHTAGNKLGIQQGHRRRDPRNILDRSMVNNQDADELYQQTSLAFAEERKIINLDAEYKAMNKNMAMAVSQFGLAQTADDNKKRNHGTSRGKLSGVTMVGM